MGIDAPAAQRVVVKVISKTALLAARLSRLAVAARAVFPAEAAVWSSVLSEPHAARRECEKRETSREKRSST